MLIFRYIAEIKQEMTIEHQELSVLVKTENELSIDLSSSETTNEPAANRVGIDQHCCEFCSIWFTNKSKLNMHLNERHAGREIKIEEQDLPLLKKIKDEPTSSSISNQTADPEAANSGLKQFKCNFCSIYFLDKSNLVSHLTTHSDNQPFQCEVCGSKFKRVRLLTLHQNTHTKHEQFSCEICNETFLLHSEFYVHRKTHTHVYPYVCDICRAKFRRKLQLVKHRNKHTTLPEYTCSICSRTFTTERSLTIHLDTHSAQGSLQCDICNIQFKLKDTLDQHCRAVHLENDTT